MRNSLTPLLISADKDGRNKGKVTFRDSIVERSIHRKTRRNQMDQHHTKLVGKIYADWCPHCISLKPEWNKMKQKAHKRMGKSCPQFVEIEESQIDEQKGGIEKEIGAPINVDGYPTLFKSYKKGHIEYYKGPRTADQMADWVTTSIKGGRRPRRTRKMKISIA